MSSLPPISTLPSLITSQGPSAFTSILDLLFEPSPALHTLTVPALLTPAPAYPSYAALIAAVQAQLTTLQAAARAEQPPAAATAQLDAILGSHPRLGAKKVDSAQSAGEQAQLAGSAAEGEALARLNAEYEAAFPGLRYVVFVNGRGRPEIMDDMRARIARGDLERERTEGIQVRALLLFLPDGLAWLRGIWFFRAMLCYATLCYAVRGLT